AHAGIFNFESMYGATEETFFSDWDMGGPYWAPQAKNSYGASPHKFVKNWDTPILIIQGGKDFRIPETQAFEAFNVAQMLDIPSKFLYFPEENHWIMKPQNSLLWQREFFGWLDKYLK
ncbi:MAG TPA: peptidase S9, partial [Bacteroidales bacterium]|nr:peptidase S9 [Bacteroidales bacterium]